MQWNSTPLDDRLLADIGVSRYEIPKLVKRARPDYVYAHRWRPGDLLVWDNRWMHHSTTPYTYEGQRRLLHRVSGEGDEVPV